MKWKPVAVFVITLVAAPQVSAGDVLAGITLGQVSTEESDTDNLGFVAGYSSPEGYGYEVFMLNTIDADSASVSRFSADISTDVMGIFGVYKYDIPGDMYLKGKLGYGIVNLDIDVDGRGKFSDSESGFALGFAAGITLGPGNLELSYTTLPSLGDFDTPDSPVFGGIKVNADTDFIALSYIWNL